MQSDKELLMLAAKAGGLQVDEGATPMTWNERKKIAILNSYGGHTLWNSLADGGDALWLAVKLKMFLDLEHCNAANSADPVTLWYGGGDDEHAGVMHEDCDPMAATRRAITRAAAQLAQAAQEGK